jgi:hypothetical protein
MTPGPPEKHAFPMALKVPPPMMAAIPKKVRSPTDSTRLMLVLLPSASAVETGFFRSKEFDILKWQKQI